MIGYLLQTVVFQLLFLIVYELLLKKETFFQWNRFYLCLTPLLALIFPFIKIPALQTIIPQNFAVVLPEIILGPTSVTAQNTLATKAFETSVFEIILLSGIILSTVLFFWKLNKIFQLKRKGKTEIMEGTTLVRLPDSTDAFSFGILIFIGEKLEQNARKHIINHELVHIKQKHYVDLIYFELLRIVFWFNPLIYLFQNRVATLHEYIADSRAVAATDKKTYYQNLLTEVFKTQHISFINTFFNHSLIKKRIVMLQKSKSKKSQLIKYALILPLIAGMLFIASCEQNQSERTENEGLQTNTKIEQIQEGKDLTLDIPFAVIDQVPVYPGCENLSTNKERKYCFSNKITQLVSENFDTSVSKNSGLKGRQRISVQFKVNKEGKIETIEARAAYEPFVEEAKRVMGLIPQLTPGKHEGKTVSVLYSLPIIFEL